MVVVEEATVVVGVITVVVGDTTVVVVEASIMAGDAAVTVDDAAVMADDGAVMAGDATVVVGGAAVMALLVVEDMLGGNVFIMWDIPFVVVGDILFVIVGSFFVILVDICFVLWEISFRCHCGRYHFIVVCVCVVGVVVIVGGTADLDIVTSVRFTPVDSQTTHTHTLQAILWVAYASTRTRDCAHGRRTFAPLI